MNTEQLLSIIRELVDDEDREGIQAKLAAVSTAMVNLAANPQQPAHQTEVSEALRELETAVDLAYSPTSFERMGVIGARPYFSPSLVARIRQSMADNPMTPAVVQKELETLVDERDDYVINLRRLLESLEAFGFTEDELQEGQAEIGFQIPRAIFDNELEGFSRELHELRLIIRAFSEAADNSGERIELRQISTSDPLIYVMLGYLTICKIGASVKWCLDQWKTLEEVRNLRANTAKLAAVPQAQALAEQFDAIIDQTIQTRIRERAEALAAESTSDEGRRHELGNHLAKALEGLLARIERGMKVDIRVLPPPEPEKDQEPHPASADYQRLEEIRDELIFPELASSEPILHLTKQPEAPAGPVRKRRKRSE